MLKNYLAPVLAGALIAGIVGWGATRLLNPDRPAQVDPVQRQHEVYPRWRFTIAPAVTVTTTITKEQK